VVCWKRGERRASEDDMDEAPITQMLHNYYDCNICVTFMSPHAKACICRGAGPNDCTDANGCGIV